jgi:hypothetical protein
LTVSLTGLDKPINKQVTSRKLPALLHAYAKLNCRDPYSVISLTSKSKVDEESLIAIA